MDISGYLHTQETQKRNWLNSIILNSGLELVIHDRVTIVDPQAEFLMVSAPLIHGELFDGDFCVPYESITALVYRSI